MFFSGMGLRRRERGLLVSSVETGGTADAHGIKLGVSLLCHMDLDR